MSGEQVQGLYAEAQALESQYTALAQQESSIAAAFRDAEAAATTLRAAEAPSFESLLPIGAGVFLGARVENSDSVVVNVGAGVAMRKDRKYAMNHVESRLKELQVAAGNVSSRRAEIAARLDQIRSELSALASAARGNV